MKELIMAVSSPDTESWDDGQLNLGARTKATCRRAIFLAPTRRRKPVILVAGGRANDSDEFSVGELMEEFICHQDASVVVEVVFASYRGVSAEMRALAAFSKQHSDLESIVIISRPWNGPKRWCLCRYWLWKLKVHGVRVIVSYY